MTTNNRADYIRMFINLCLLPLSFIVIISSTGCVTTKNGFSEYYKDLSGAAITNLPPYSGETKIITASANPTNDLRDIFRNNYFLIGFSSFQGPPQSQDMLLSHAKKIGADVVLLTSVYLGRQQTAVPFVQYHPGQTSTTTSSGTVNANVYGSGGGYAYGTGNYSGSSTTTSPGTFSTQVVPVTVQSLLLAFPPN